MTIHFRSDSSVTSSGFAASYNEWPNYNGGSCGGYLDNANGIVSSPYYPDSYPNSASCIWHIRVESHQIIDLQFSDFDLEMGQNCLLDYVAIYDGPSTNSTLLARLCSNPSEALISSSNSMTIYFRSDHSVTSRGFIARYQSLPINNGHMCGGYLGDAFGSLFSPGYPYPYPNNADCIWYIRVNSTQKVLLWFSVFELEATSSCSYDFVAVYDGPTTDSALLGKLCIEANETFTSTSNSMTIHFRSDSSQTRSGFAASYHARPNNIGEFC
ncbi:deleted in malignant brain tumors 1 protein-like [Leucoraja erinacea]|uniref:deleted in malignant brain tumors 1 protein-like n=1 Tax=Leucoraja erinaceus TaxID=7782 RepID=UPI002455E49A|nr:deleted in malignant brain tumors 1 protein-like [Leucoraja erinacea]